MSTLNNLDIKLLSDMLNVNISPPSASCLEVLAYVYFAMQKFFSFI